MIAAFIMPEILENFLNYISAIKGRSTATVQMYEKTLRMFFRFILIHKKNVPPPDGFKSENLPTAINSLKSVQISQIDLHIINKISIEDLYSFIVYLKMYHKNNERSRARVTVVLHTFFKYLHNNKLVDENVSLKLEAPKIGKSLPVHLELDSAKQLILTTQQFNNIRDYTIIVLFLNCGMRLSELVGLNISDLSQSTLVVTGKGNKQRTIYLNETCRRTLDDYLKFRLEQKNKQTPALFLNNQGTRLGARSVERLVKKYIDRAGLDSNKYTVHKLRHTAATLMYQHGNVDIRALQEILGHEQLSTTEIYTHINQEQLQKAVEKNPLNMMNSEFIGEDE